MHTTHVSDSTGPRSVSAASLGDAGSVVAARANAAHIADGAKADDPVARSPAAVDTLARTGAWPVATIPYTLGSPVLNAKNVRS
jgi:hypothetical protein